MRKIGLHFRLQTTVSALFEKALRLQSPLLQCFLIKQGSNEYASFTEEEVKKCQRLAKEFDQLYLHASYWVNLAGKKNNGWRAFQRELSMAKLLGFTHIVIHPGSATGCETKDEGIIYLAKALNKALSLEKDIKIVLENGAHARKTVGGDLTDFAKLLKLLDEPERVLFCIDTAHAHSFGYDIIDPEKQELFLQEMDRVLGKQLALIHLNETKERCGSYIDRHDALGDGVIGNQALKRFMNHPVCKKVPIILEIPLCNEEQEEKELLSTAQRWNKENV